MLGKEILLTISNLKSACLVQYIKNSDKEKWVYSDCGTTFHGAGLWKFGSDFERNVVIFGVYNNLSSHADNYKDKCLI